MKVESHKLRNAKNLDLRRYNNIDQLAVLKILPSEQYYISPSAQAMAKNS